MVGHEDGQRPNIRKETHLTTRTDLPTSMHAIYKLSADGTHLIDVVDDSIHHLPLERFEHDRAVPCHKLSLSATRHDHPLSNVQNRDDSNDVAELAGTGALDVGVQFRFEELEHPRAEVGRVEVDCVRQFFLLHHHSERDAG